MGFDRSKYTATSLAVLKEQQQQQEAVRPSNNFDRSFLKIEAGDNKFRIMPFHPNGGGKSYAEAKTVSFLECSGPKRDESGKVIEGEVEVKRRPVWHARVHGGFKHDLVDVYLDIAKTQVIPEFAEGDDKKFKTIWNKLVGQEGVRPQDTWAVYAMKAIGTDTDGNTKWGPLGILDLKKSMKDQMQDLASKFSDGLQSPDPFTGLDDGIAITIHKSGKKLDTEYKVDMDSQTVKENNKIVTEYVLTPLSDELMEQFDKMDSLHKIYRGVFKRSSLLSQIEGLQNMDADLKKAGYPLEICQHPEFMKAVDELADIVPDDDVKEEAEEEKPKKAAQKSAPAKAPAATVLKKKAPPAPPAPEPDPILEEEVEEEEQEEEEEQSEEVEVKEVVRKQPAAAPVTRPAPAPATPPHIAKTDTALDIIRQRLGGKK